MPCPCEFRAETVIEADISTVFAFHENPENIRQITPRWQQVLAVDAQRSAVVGEHFTLRLRLFGLVPVNWEGVWRAAERPRLLVDEIVHGPFAYWRHEHIFRELGPASTLMIDQVSYQFFGGWLGKWFGETAGRLQFFLMFADRQARTRKHLLERK